MPLLDNVLVANRMLEVLAKKREQLETELQDIALVEGIVQNTLDNDHTDGDMCPTLGLLLRNIGLFQFSLDQRDGSFVDSNEETQFMNEYNQHAYGQESAFEGPWGNNEIYYQFHVQEAQTQGSDFYNKVPLFYNI